MEEKMRSIRIEKYLKELKKYTPEDIKIKLNDTDYQASIRGFRAGPRKVIVKKGSRMAFVNYTGEEWQAPYGDMELIAEIIGKLKGDVNG
ncbi:MAG: hypothetical protein QXU82_02715 [Candidatus Aenigmatarchaeota archaeon]